MHASIIISIEPYLSGASSLESRKNERQRSAERGFMNDGITL